MEGHVLKASLGEDDSEAGGTGIGGGRKRQGATTEEGVPSTEMMVPTTVIFRCDGIRERAITESANIL